MLWELKSGVSDVVFRISVVRSSVADSGFKPACN